MRLGGRATYMLPEHREHSKVLPQHPLETQASANLLSSVLPSVVAGWSLRLPARTRAVPHPVPLAVSSKGVRVGASSAPLRGGARPRLAVGREGDDIRRSCTGMRSRVPSVAVLLMVYSARWIARYSTRIDG
jgi:hypothetical protein